MSLMVRIGVPQYSLKAIIAIPESPRVYTKPLLRPPPLAAADAAADAFADRCPSHPFSLDVYACPWTYP
jgi:hypothetical protein